MAIKDLKAREGNVNIVVEVVEKDETREFQKFGNTGRVANATVKDDAGDTIKLTLWNDDIDKVNVGNKVEITNGYVSEWQGELQLTTGKFGTLKVLENGSEGKQEEEKSSEEEEKKESSEEEVSEPVEEAVENNDENKE